MDNALYNYALFCLVTLQDMDRARRVYVECLRRMQYRGPDIPFVLYSYAVFAMKSHDEDYLDVRLKIEFSDANLTFCLVFCVRRSGTSSTAPKRPRRSATCLSRPRVENPRPGPSLRAPTRTAECLTSRKQVKCLFVYFKKYVDNFVMLH